MSALDAFRDLPSVVNAQIGMPVRITRAGLPSAAATPQEAYIPQTGRETTEQEGTFTTSMAGAGPDVVPGPGSLMISEGSGTISVGHADSGSYFDPKRGDTIEFLDGSLQGLIVTIGHSEFSQAGGGRRLTYASGSGAAGTPGAGTDAD